MGVQEYVSEIASAIPAARAFKAFVLDSDTLIPKVVPQAIQSVKLLEGDGGPGSLNQINFGEGSKNKFVKHRVEGLDKENFNYSYTIIKGDAIEKALEKIEMEIKIKASPEGGSILKSNSKYYTKGDAEVKPEEIKVAKEKSAGLFKAIQAYLLANPNCLKYFTFLFCA